MELPTEKQTVIRTKVINLYGTIDELILQLKNLKEEGYNQVECYSILVTKNTLETDEEFNARVDFFNKEQLKKEVKQKTKKKERLEKKLEKVNNDINTLEREMEMIYKNMSFCCTLTSHFDELSKKLKGLNKWKIALQEEHKSLI